MIKFPRVHIATSVVNRILNVADGISATSGTRTEPSVPDPTLEGAALTARLAEQVPPVGEVGGPESQTANAAEAVISGGSPLQGLLDTVSGQ